MKPARLALVSLLLGACGAPAAQPVAPHLPGEPCAAVRHGHKAPELPGLLKPGAAAPDFALEDATGRVRTLSELHASGPAIVVFYHGSWCQSCRNQLDRLQKKSKDLPANVLIAAISTDPHLTAAKMATQLDLTFPVLMDAELKAANAFGVADTVQGLSLLAIFVIDKDGKVRWQHVGEDSFVEDQALDAARAAAG